MTYFRVNTIAQKVDEIAELSAYMRPPVVPTHRIPGEDVVVKAPPRILDDRLSYLEDQVDSTCYYILLKYQPAPNISSGWFTLSVIAWITLRVNQL